MENNNNDNKKKNNFGKLILINIFILVFIGLYAKSAGTNTTTDELKEISYSELLTQIEKNEKKDMELTERVDGIVSLKVEKEKVTYTTQVPNDNKIGEYVEKYNIDYSKTEIPKTFFETLSSYIWIILGVVFFIFIFSLFKGQKDTFDKQQQMVKNSKALDNPKIKLDDIGGLPSETKQEVLTMIDTFKNAEQAKKYGIRPVKGAVLYGPPGTGKTLLAQGIANELNAKFFTISGSGFNEMYVGVGAARVRDLFDKARKEGPSLIFIDEVDAIAGRRSPMGGNSEKESTLNQLLTELDGVQDNKDIMVIVATNRLDMLDEAFVRAGRFDFKIKIDLPDLDGRKEIIKIHTKNKPLSKDVLANLDDIAKNTYGYSGAEIEGLFLVAATNAFSLKKEEIDMEDINYAIDRSLLGSKGKKIDKEELKRRVAYHEAGHALLQVLAKEGSVRKATIAPRGGALGYVATIPDELNLETYSGLLKKVQMILAGGLAEMKKFEEHSVGVGGDVQQAKKLIEQMVDLGMGTGNFKLTFSEKNKNERMQEIFDKAVEECDKVLNEYEEQHEALAMALLEKETLDIEEIEFIVLGKIPEVKETVEEAEEVSEEEVQNEEEVKVEVVEKEITEKFKLDINKKPSEI